MDEKPSSVDLRTLRGKAAQAISLERKLSCAKLLNKGWTLREIAAELDLTLGQVANVSRALVRESERQFQAQADKLRARLLQQNRVFQRECWEHLERAKLGHIRQELEEAVVPESTAIAGQATSAKSSATIPSKRRTIRENDLMAEARILETLRKAQADEAKILGWRPPDDPTPPGETNITDNRSIVIINNAEVTADAPWVASIERGTAKQGVGLLPPGETLAEVVKSALAEKPKP